MEESQPARRRFRVSRLQLYLLAFAIQLALAPFFLHDWDGFVFTRSATDLLGGLSPYEVAEQAPSHIFLDDHWPPLNTWYAYPPLELLLIAPFVGLAKALSAEPMVLRVGLKIPFILGGLALAYVGGVLARRLAPADSLAARDRAERWLLLNPFLIFIAAVWGMFDATMMALLLLSVVLLDARRPMLGGVAFGLAALVKVFPLFVAPIFLVYAAKRMGAKAASVFVATSAGVFALVCLPFFLEAPAGFWQQTVGLHAQRSPQGFALVSFPLQLRNVNNLFQWEIPILPESSVVALAGALLMVALALLFLRSPRVTDTRALLLATLAGFMALLLVNKVVNEQYLVLPIALLTVLAAASDLTAKRALRAFTWGGLASGVLIGLHFLTFIPADVSKRSIIGRPDELVGLIATTVNLPVLVVVSIPHVIALLALIPAMVWALRYLVPQLREGASALAHGVRRILPTGAPRLAADGAVALMLIAAPIASAVLAAPGEPDALPDLPASGLVLARYDLAIHNPSHDPAVRDGYWLRAGMPEPLEGWYALTTGKARADVHALRGLGVDVLLVAHSAGNRLRVDTFLAAVDEAGLRAAPTIDLGQLGHCPDALRLSPTEVPPPGTVREEDADLIAACAGGALHWYREHRAAFRPDGRVALVVLNASAAPDAAWVRDALPEDAYILAGVSDGARPAWADAAYAQPDATLGELRDETARLADGASPRVAAVVTATWAIRDADAYATTWSDALALRADWVVLPWNVHRDGGAIEPVRGGPDLLDATRGNAAALEAAPRAL